MLSYESLISQSTTYHSHSSDKNRALGQVATREFREIIRDDTNQPCLICQTCFKSGLHTLPLNSKVRLILKGKKEISLGILSEKCTGINTSAPHNASKVPHSFISTSLPIHILKPYSHWLENGQLTIQHQCCVGFGSCLWRNIRHSETQLTPLGF